MERPRASAGRHIRTLSGTAGRERVVIRFSAFLVVVAVGLLVAGVVTSKLLLVYIAIGVSGVALLALGVGTAVNWRELTGKSGTAHPETAESGTLDPSAQGPVPQ